jgi:outer membrane protein
MMQRPSIPRPSAALAAISVIAVTALLSAPLAAQAQSSGSLLGGTKTVKFGFVYEDVRSRTTGLRGVGVPPGADAKVEDAKTLIGTIDLEVAPNWSLELALGVPPKVKAKATGSVAFLGDVLEAKSVSPTFFVNYKFFDAKATLRPYVGLGLNYTKFTGIKNPFGWQVDLSDSSGLAAHAGVDWKLGSHWGLWASVSMVKVETDLTAVGASVLQTTIDFRPVIFGTGLYMRF